MTWNWLLRGLSSGRLNTAFLKSLEPDRLLHNFRVNAGLPSVAKPLEGWESPGVGLRGHFVGHYLSAVSVGGVFFFRYEFSEKKMFE